MLLALHVIVVVLTGLLVLYSDEQAAVWVLGKKETLDPKRVALLHTGVSIGLGLLILTGAFLYADSASAYLTSTTSLIKMAAVAALIINTAVISRLMPVATTRAYASLTARERLPLFVSGAVSVAGWLTAIACGLLLA